MPYLTPSDIPATTICRNIRIPNNIDIIGAVTGALSELGKEFRWEQFGAVQPEEIAEAMRRMLLDFEGTNDCMIGAIFPIATGVPQPNWLRCNGASHLRVDYPDLYAVIHEDFIIDADSFFVPSIVGVFVLGAHLDFPLHEYGGEIDHVLTIGEMPAHDHALNTSNAAVTVGAGAPTTVKVPIGTQTSGNRGAGAPHNNMPPYFAMNYAIVAK